MSDIIAPRLFVSYSWSSEDHEAWVINLSSALREAEVDVILDKWDLREGQDANHFMEKMVSDDQIKKVIMICDRIYAEKANGRTGGVGTETQIISAEVYSKQDQSKFVAVLSERDSEGKPFLPTYYTSRIFIDLSSQEEYAREFERLLRWIFDKPLHVKPPLGKRPAFLSDDASKPTLGTTVLYQRALDAIKNNKVYRSGAVSEYLDRFVDGLSQFTLDTGDGEHDDKVVKSIEEFIPYRNEAAEIFSALASYGTSTDEERSLHRFLEKIHPFMYSPRVGQGYHEWDWDNYRFIVHELFLYLVVLFLRFERFDFIGQLLRQPYYVSKPLDKGGETISFADFYQDMQSMEHRKQRLNSNLISIRADLINARVKNSGLTIEQITQADFVLFMRDCIDVIRGEGYQHWWPTTLLYREGRGAFEIFARAQSAQYFNKIKVMFDITNGDDFKDVFDAIKKGRLSAPRGPFWGIDPVVLTGSDKLGSKP